MYTEILPRERGGDKLAATFKQFKGGEGARMTAIPSCYMHMTVKIKCLVNPIIPVIQKYLDSQVSRCEEGPARMSNSSISESEAVLFWSGCEKHLYLHPHTIKFTK